jgi:succinoglycan biosynthesis protein ExoV
LRYIYYKDPAGNFGDDLNDWLWPIIFGRGSQHDDNKLFYGIGTILSKSTKLVDTNSKIGKIVFGTGVRPSFDPITIDKSWDIKFVRGPLSSMALGGEVEYISDAAYTIRHLDSFPEFLNSDKKHEISLIPHISSTSKFDWRAICIELGFNYISPHSESGVEYTIREIASSKYILAEAMHGAILADILRIPWKRFVLSTTTGEGTMISEFKWMDWLFSLKIPATKTIHINLYRKTFLNKLLLKGTLGIVNAEFLLKRKVGIDILKKLSSITPQDFYLSDQNVICDIDLRLKEKIQEIRCEIYQHNSMK